MEQRFSKCISDIKILINKFKKQNDPIVSQMKDICPEIPERLVTDAIYTLTSTTHASLRISLFNSDQLVENLSEVIQALLIPYQLRIDVGYSCITPDKSIYVVHPSRNSCINTDQKIIKNLDSIENLFSELGWEYQPGPDFKRNDTAFVKKIIDRHDALFGLFSNSKFILGTVFYVELYINADARMVDLWQNSSE